MRLCRVDSASNRLDDAIRSWPVLTRPSWQARLQRRTTGSEGAGQYEGPSGRCLGIARRRSSSPEQLGTQQARQRSADLLAHAFASNRSDSSLASSCEHNTSLLCITTLMKILWPWIEALDPSLSTVVEIERIELRRSRPVEPPDEMAIPIHGHLDTGMPEAPRDHERMLTGGDE